MRRITSKIVYDLKQVRRVVVFVAGLAVLLLGIVMLVAPGPGILTVALGLGILAMEFLWARRLLKRFRKKGSNFAHRLLSHRLSAAAFEPRSYRATARPASQSVEVRSPSSIRLALSDWLSMRFPGNCCTVFWVWVGASRHGLKE